MLKQFNDDDFPGASEKNAIGHFHCENNIASAKHFSNMNYIIFDFDLYM